MNQQAQLNFEQSENLDRVTSKIGQAVLNFLKEKGHGKEFTTIELYLYCLDQIEHLAPGSSCRVMRHLAKEGRIEYQVINRSQSRYKLTHI